MDAEQRAEFERAYWEKYHREQLEAARAALNVEQLERLKSHAELLREMEIYAPKYETDIAKIIRTDYSPRHQTADIKAVYARAENEARTQQAKDHLATQMLALKEAEQQREQQAQREIQDQQRQRDAELIARRQRDFETTQMIQQAAGVDRQRHQNGRYNELRRPSEEPTKAPPQNSTYDYSGTRTTDSDWRATARELLDGGRSKSDAQQERDQEKDRIHNNTLGKKGPNRGGRTQ